MKTHLEFSGDDCNFFFLNWGNNFIDVINNK